MVAAMVCSERDAALAVCLNRLIELQVLSSLRLRRKTAQGCFRLVSARLTARLAVISPPWPGREERAVAEIDDLVTVSIKYIMGMRAIV
ncbi:hypothetical protein [Tardiphaga sp. 42S5]|uniref:hypothetical protein n=1 Tax=Tardiphaga sp. 42S5 TaxID=1404799 RepID=UPI002A5A84E8|nr:hypothetical protein [Tardiphaga sp. 42S5]WPO40075.1 hypothetical protein SFY93_21380 [Tardiphaga sp. 42S5]